MSEKQDRYGARTAADLERKYNFGKTFAELLGIANDARNSVDKVYSELSNELHNQVTAIYRDTEKIILSALEEYVKATEYEEYKKTSKSELKIMADEISANVQTTTEINNDLQEFREESKSELKILSDEISANVQTTTEISTDLQEFREEAGSEFKILSDEISANVDKTTEITEELRTFKETSATDFSVLSNQISMGVTTTTEQINKVSGDLQEASNEIADLDEATAKFKETVTSELQLMADKLALSFESTLEQISNVDGDVQSIREELEKHFVFSTDGLTIKAGENSMNLVLDNDIISFTKNGKQFGWWDGVNFHTGNIVVNVSERAQFGNFAFVPRSNGSLDFLKVGG